MALFVGLAWTVVAVVFVIVPLLCWALIRYLVNPSERSGIATFASTFGLALCIIAVALIPGSTVSQYAH
jgi:hypothetical protein